MLTTDHFFLLYFLPLFLIGYFLLQHKKSLANYWIIFTSVLFYASFNVPNTLFLIIPPFIDFFVAKNLPNLRDTRVKKFLLILYIVGNLCILAYFKYNFFFAQTIRGAFPSTTFLRNVTQNVIAPVGISFLTFQRISYLVDVYRKKHKPAQNLIDYLVYSMFFPHLIAGPIVRFHQVVNDLKTRVISYEYLFEGIKYFAIGLALKVIIADRIFIFEDDLTQHLAKLNTGLSILLILSFSLRIYFDFLGYSLIAIGIAKWAGFHFPDNFDSPYRSSSLQDFWRRWNITLSFWIRDYVYIPLGGSKKGQLRTYFNLILTMLLAGLWHGASWSFVIWGGIHGIGLSIERILKPLVPFKLPKAIGQIITFGVVTLAWIPFKFNTIDQLDLFFTTIKNTQFYWLDKVSENIFYTTIPIFLLSIFWILYCSELKIKDIKPSIAKITFFCSLFLFCLGLSLIRKSTPFIYFQF